MKDFGPMIGVALAILAGLLSGCDGADPIERPRWFRTETGTTDGFRLMIHADTLWRIAGRAGLWSRPADSFDGAFTYEGHADSSRGIRYGSCSNDPCSGVMAAAASTDIDSGAFIVVTIADSNRIVRRVGEGRWIQAMDGFQGHIGSESLAATRENLVAIGATFHFSADGVRWTPTATFTNLPGPVLSLEGTCDVFAAGGGATGMSPSVYSSSDCGETWDGAGVGNVLPTTAAVNGFAVDSRPGNFMVYAYDIDGLIRSGDHGNTWIQLSLPSQAERSTYGLEVDDRDGGLWLVARNEREADGRLFHSTDGGTTWNVIPTEILDGEVPLAVEWDRKRSALFIDTETSVYTFRPE